ncbi:Transglycosylase SLT domain protein [Shimia sp. SK013]|nr:Transglycosylase SLT domain protein [Shimia sp. SK013]
MYWQKAHRMKKQKFFNVLTAEVRLAFRRIAPRFVTISLSLCSALLIPTSAQASYGETCDRVARIAAGESGVPVEVMMAITRTETGRRANGALAPWPWTVNMEGVGKWFDTREEALTFAVSGLKQGKRSFDVGCFQLNYRWHGEHFKDVHQMFEPLENARYAADFLARLYSETQSWESAAAAYHSRTPKYADKYKARYKQILANLPDIPALGVATRTAGTVTAPTQRVVRQASVNAFPLLRKGVGVSGMGSLVPLGNSENRPLFDGGS